MAKVVKPRTIKLYEPLVNTIGVFSFFMKDNTLFFEFIQELKEYSCEKCGNSVGNDLIIKVLKLFGGMTIEIPAIDEIEIYKYFIENPEIVMHYGKQNNFKGLEAHVVELFELQSPLDIQRLGKRFYEVIKERDSCQTIASLTFKERLQMNKKREKK